MKLFFFCSCFAAYLLTVPLALADNFEIVQIKINPSENLRGYLYRGMTTTTNETTGAILYLHGGPDLADPARPNKVREYFLQKGSTILDVDYRNAYKFPEDKYPLPPYNCHLVADADIEDAIVSIHYLKELTDKKRIVVFAHSNGGEIATRLAFFFPNEAAAIVNLEGFSGDWNYRVPDYCRPDRDKRYPYDYMNKDMILKATPMLSYYGTSGGFALPAGRGRLDHEESDMIHGYARVKKAKELGITATPFQYSSMPEINPCHIYLEYPDNHFPSKTETLNDLLPRIEQFIEKNAKE